MRTSSWKLGVLVPTVLVTATWAAACGGGGSSDDAFGDTNGSGSGDPPQPNADAGNGIFIPPPPETDGGTIGLPGDSGRRPIGSRPGDKCEGIVEKAENVDANLLFVLDKSGSMNCNLPEDGQTSADCETHPEPRGTTGADTKWEKTRVALEAALNELSKQKKVKIGLKLFPRDDHCETHLDPPADPIAPDVAIDSLSAKHKQEIVDLLASTSPGGQTPYAGATIEAYQYLLGELKAKHLKGNTFVVLITDGAETCSEPALQSLLGQQAATAFGINVRTFVIGSPGSETARGKLAELAFQGGTPGSATCSHNDPDSSKGDCHFDMTLTANFAADLKKALEAIGGSKELTCEFDLPKDQKIDPCRVNVTFTPSGGAAPQKPFYAGKTDCAANNTATPTCEPGADGWQYNADKSKILLCGKICAAVQDDGEGQVEIVLGCKIEVPA